jgi:hypothetical protein
VRNCEPDSITNETARVAQAGNLISCPAFRYQSRLSEEPPLPSHSFISFDPTTASKSGEALCSRGVINSTHVISLSPALCLRDSDSNARRRSAARAKARYASIGSKSSSLFVAMWMHNGRRQVTRAIFPRGERRFFSPRSRWPKTKTEWAGTSVSPRPSFPKPRWACYLGLCFFRIADP